MIIGIQPFVEFPLIPVAVVLARRFGSIRLVAIAAGIAMIGNVDSLADTATMLLVAQALQGVVWGVFAAMGVIIAQRLLPIAVATASGVFLSSGAIGSAFGGFLGYRCFHAWFATGLHHSGSLLPVSHDRAIPVKPPDGASYIDGMHTMNRDLSIADQRDAADFVNAGWSRDGE
ncbi:MAG: hypothetical protein M9950_12290 [Thermomicrobiales bacterium]|nr:hypothetical protein [Thermomicrobiales bacterium]